MVRAHTVRPWKSAIENELMYKSEEGLMMIPLNANTPVETPDTEELLPPLTLPRRAEVWGGRLAMVGFTTTVVAIALRANI